MINQCRCCWNHKPRHLPLRELERSKTSILNTIGPMPSRRSCPHAMNRFVASYCSEPRLDFDKIMVLHCGVHLKSRTLAAGTNSPRLGALTHLAYEGPDSGLLGLELAAATRREISGGPNWRKHLRHRQGLEIAVAPSGIGISECYQ